MKTCFFCPNKATSAEHIISLGIIAHTGLENAKIELGCVDESKEMEKMGKRPAHGVKKFTTKQVCKVCNNNWMSHLEVGFIATLGDLIQPHWPPWWKTVLQKTKHEPLGILRWMAKTAIMFDAAGQFDRGTLVPVEVREMTRDGKFTDDFFVLAAHIKSKQLAAAMFAGFPTVEGGKRHRYRVNKGSFSFAIQINHLALRIIRCPNGMPNVYVPKSTNRASQVAAPFILCGRVGEYLYPAYHSFDTVREFYDSTVVEFK